MDKIKNYIRAIPFKKAFFTMVLMTAVLIGALSAAIISGCLAVREYLLNSVENAVVEQRLEGKENIINYEYTLAIVDDRIIHLGEDGAVVVLSKEYKIKNLSDKQRILYYISTASIVLVPFILIVIGILLCAYLFYRLKIAKPYELLMTGARNISDNNLDFRIEYMSKDEMGMLCSSFEKMRCSLLEDNLRMWDMIEQSRQVNASIAHDLRTPITVIKGYTEHLQRQIPKGNVSDEKLMRTLSCLSDSADRMEYYVNSLRDLHSMETMTVSKEVISLPELLDSIRQDFLLLAEQSKIEFSFYEHDIPKVPINIDRQIIFRASENVFTNALRYAKSKISLHCSFSNQFLTLCIQDDGKGFSEKALNSASNLFFKEESGKGHLGLGLSICELLCCKHGGELVISNAPDGGGQVILTFYVAID